jgi:preprotein translocase subunit SecE
MTAERIKIAIAALIAIGGLVAFYWMVDRQPLVIRLGALLGAFAVAAAVMWFTEAGKTFVAFARESLTLPRSAARVS